MKFKTLYTKLMVVLTILKPIKRGKDDCSNKKLYELWATVGTNTTKVNSDWIAQNERSKQ